jgi:co-chaperonin GroES (HSP10)
LDIYEQVTNTVLENELEEEKFVAIAQPKFFGDGSVYEEHLLQLSEMRIAKKMQEDKLREGKPILLQVPYDEIIAYERYGQIDSVGSHILVMPIAEHQTTESGLWLSTQPNKTLKGIVAYKGEGLKCHRQYDYSEVYRLDTLIVGEDIVWLNNNSDWIMEIGSNDNKRDYYVCKRQDILAVVEELFDNFDATKPVEGQIVKLVMPYMKRCLVEVLDDCKDIWQYVEDSKLFLSSYGIKRRKRCVKVRILGSNEQNDYARVGMICYATHIETTIESDGKEYHFIKEQDILLEIEDEKE